MVKILNMLLIIWSCRRWYIFCGVSSTIGASEVPSSLLTSSHIKYSVACGHGWSPSPFLILYRVVHCGIFYDSLLTSTPGSGKPFYVVTWSEHRTSVHLHSQTVDGPTVEYDLMVLDRWGMLVSSLELRDFSD